MTTLPKPSPRVNSSPRYPICRKAILDRGLKPNPDPTVAESFPVWDGRFCVDPDGSRGHLSDPMRHEMKALIVAGHFGDIRLRSRTFRRKSAGATLYPAGQLPDDDDIMLRDAINALREWPK
jgi:hypothetical protein